MKRLAAAALALCAVVGCAGDEEAVLVVEARRGDFEKVLALRGRLAAAETVTIRAGARGTISWMAPEGTVVEKDDVLLTLETEDIQEKLDQALLDLAVAEANLGKSVEEARIQRLKDRLSLQEKEASLELSRLKADEAREDLEKKRRQVEASILPAKELPAAELGLQQAELNLANARIDLERLKEEIASRRQTGALDRRTAEARLEKQRSEVAEREEYLENATVRAPRSGIVVHAERWDGKTYNVGDQVHRNTTLMEIPDLSVMQVEAEVHEVDVAAIESGTPARVRVHAFPDLALEGRVEEITGLARELKDRDGRGTGVRVFDVVVGLERREPRLRPGMTASVELVLERLEDAVLVPVAALRDGGGTSRVVLASGEERPVEVAAANADHAVISSGLAEGEGVRLVASAPDEGTEQDEAEPEASGTPGEADGAEPPAGGAAGEALGG